MSENFANLSSRKGLSDNLFERLVQSKGAMVELKNLATEFKVGEANLLAAASSYDFIQGDNANKKAYLCNGSSCLCAGTQAQVKSSLLEHFSDGDIGHVTCLGRCHENAAFQISGQNYSGEDHQSIANFIKDDAPSAEALQVYCLLESPILTDIIDDITQFYGLLSTLTKQQDKPQIIQQIIDSGLRGRGGAGFPTGIKWQACANEISPQKYIVCNADEGDPGAFSDRYLMEQNPHTILFGMLIAGLVSGANWGVIYIRDEYPESVKQMQLAINEFEALNLLPDDFLFQFKIIRGAGSYICGEETALLRSIEGQKPMVSVRPPFPTSRGLFGKPTILNNVETFASIHWILQHTGQAYSEINQSGKSTGSKLLCLDSSFFKPGIYEVKMGMPLSAVIEAAGGYKSAIKALHIGGPLGGIVPVDKIADLTVDFESFSQQGFLLGHASIIGIPESLNLAEYVQHLFQFTADESCGKCFPCRLGATRGYEMFNDAIEGKSSLNKTLLDDLLETMEKGSLCALGGGVPLPVKNALEYFYDEFKPLMANNNSIPIKESI